MKHPITINALRNMMSASSVTGHEAYAVAEKQAHKFLHLSGCTVPGDITPAIEALPKVRIDIRPNMPVSGAVEWVGGYWQILINADEPPTRQRFSLAHELKHMIDHAFIPIENDTNHLSEDEEPSRNTHHESVCDYFAGCLLVPRPWLKTIWASGIQDLDQLANLFGVSRQAMAVRLSQTGLSETPVLDYSVQNRLAQAFNQRLTRSTRQRIYRRAKSSHWTPRATAALEVVR